MSTARGAVQLSFQNEAIFQLDVEIPDGSSAGISLLGGKSAVAKIESGNILVETSVPESTPSRWVRADFRKIEPVLAAQLNPQFRHS